MTKLYRASYRHLITGQYFDSEAYFESDSDARTGALTKSQFPYVISRLSIIDYNSNPPVLLDVPLSEDAKSLPDITITEREIPNPNCPTTKGKDFK